MPLKSKIPGATKKIVILGGFIVAISVSTVIGRNAGDILFSFYSNLPKETEIENVLQKIEHTVASKLPKQINEFTALTGVSHINHQITFTYTISADGFTLDESAQKEAVISEVCNNDNMKKL